jgi:hypothetical protein
MKRSIALALFFLTFPHAVVAMNNSNKDSAAQRQAWLDSMLQKTIEVGSGNDISIAEDLLKKKANPNCECEDNITLLHSAVEKRRIDFCKLLLQYKANVNAGDSTVHQTPLMCATGSFTDAIQDLNRKKAVQNKEYEICRLLLAHHAHINEQDIHGTTALMHASQTANRFVHKLLLANGADLRMKDSHNQNALSLSVMYDKDCRVLILNSQFYPHYTAWRLRQAQVRTRARIWTLKKICPRLTPDCKELILKSDPEIWQDACCTPLKIHTKKTDRIILMPIPILRIFLNKAILQDKAFDITKTIRLLARYKMNQLKPLMRQAHTECITRNLKESLRKMVDPSTLEEQYGNKIQENIRVELQVYPPRQESHSECTMQ